MPGLRPTAPSSVSVVIPAYNEETRLPANLRQVADKLRRAVDGPAEVLVVNDGSTDRTGFLARSVAEDVAEEVAESNVRIRVLDNPGNRGKGYSVRHGVLEARHEWVLFTDADLSAPIDEADKLFASVACGKHDVAIGSRAVDRSLIGVRQPLFRESMGRLFNVMVRLVAGLPFRDTQCGFKLFSQRAAREVFGKQRLERFGFDVEVLYLARKLGFSIAEVPVRWDDVEGTSVGMLSGAAAFLDVWRVRWNDLMGRYR